MFKKYFSYVFRSHYFFILPCLLCLFVPFIAFAALRPVCFTLSFRWFRTYFKICDQETTEILDEKAKLIHSRKWTKLTLWCVIATMNLYSRNWAALQSCIEANPFLCCWYSAIRLPRFFTCAPQKQFPYSSLIGSPMITWSAFLQHLSGLQPTINHSTKTRIR